jgi:hypothetical protein
MPARDVLWDTGMTLPSERMNNLRCMLRDGRTVPRLVANGASTQQIADAVWTYMGSLQPDPTWGWQLINSEDQSRVESMLDRGDVHRITYDPQGLYHDPMVATMVALFLCNLGALPEDEQYNATPESDPASWNWGSLPKNYITNAPALDAIETRRVYRWRVKVEWRNPRPYVTVEKLMQLQKLYPIGGRNADGSYKREWRIFNTGGQNQLYAFVPNAYTWWSGADVGDWLQTHATDIASAIEAVAWALISVVTLGIGSAAAAGVTVIKAATQILKDAAIAASTGQPFDMGKFFMQLGSAAAALVQIPGVSDLINNIGEWAKKAGETALRTLLSNGVFSSVLTSGGGFITNLASSGAKIYSEVKGWINTAPDALNAVTNLMNLTANPEQVSALIAGVAPEQIKVIIDPLLLKLSKEIADPKKLAAETLKLFQTASADLQRRIDTVKAEVLNARALLPDNLKPWFDFGARGQLDMSQAPFYAKAAVQLGQGATDLQNTTIASMTDAKVNVDAQATLFDTIERYGLAERYALLELLNDIAPRYAP